LNKQQSELPFKGDRMKKLFTIVCTLVLGGVMSFAQAGGGSTGQNPPAGDKTAPAGKSDKKTKKHHHKGGKKSKKGADAGTGTTNPK
jgi:hypothetical protein